MEHIYSTPAGGSGFWWTCPGNEMALATASTIAMGAGAGRIARAGSGVMVFFLPLIAIDWSCFLVRPAL